MYILRFLTSIYTRSFALFRFRCFDDIYQQTGTGGTFHGAGKYIKEHSPETKIVLAEPGAANLLGSGIKTERNADGSPVSSHPAFAPHPIQGECSMRV